MREVARIIYARDSNWRAKLWDMSKDLRTTNNYKMMQWIISKLGKKYPNPYYWTAFLVGTEQIVIIREHKSNPDDMTVFAILEVWERRGNEN